METDKDTIDNLNLLVDQLNTAIRRIAVELTDEACSGVDNVYESDPLTGERYGPGGHTGWLLSKRARELKHSVFNKKVCVYGDSLTAFFSEKDWNKERLDGFLLLQPGWDSYGSVQFSERIIEKAKEILDWLPGEGWRVIPCSDGSIQFEKHADGFSIEIVCEETKCLADSTYTKTNDKEIS